MIIIINVTFCTAILLLSVVKDILRVAVVLCQILLSGRSLRKYTAETIEIFVGNVCDYYKEWKEDIA
ncbi:MAG: hypothetical protein UHT92_09180 [Prevotella sp.]|nr:hypothetical protein [Prevotella sp.]